MSVPSATSSYIKNELRSSFPDEAYNAVKTGHKQYVLHFLMPSERNDADILKWLDTCNKKYADYINCPDTMDFMFASGNYVKKMENQTGLTPLSLAVLTEREGVVEGLCNSKGIDFEKKDVVGWIPLQHAIARNNPQNLSKIEAAMDATVGKVGKTAQRFPFLRGILKAQIPQSTDIVVRYRDQKGNIQSVTQQEFQEMTQGAKFFDGIIGTPNALYRNWMQDHHGNDPAYDWMNRKFEAYQNERPALILSDEGAAGLGVRADQARKRGEIMTLYGSELISPENEEAARVSHYSYVEVTGEWVRNWGAMINDGFPNVEYFPLRIDGVALGAMVSLCNIEKDEQLLNNYGYPHPVKWGRRSEPGMERILKRYPKPDSLIRELRQFYKNLKKLDKEKTGFSRFEKESQKSGLMYLLHTPSTLISLVIRGHFDLSSVQQFVADKEIYPLAGLDPKRAEGVQNFYQRAFEVIELFHKSEKSPEIRETVAKKFEENLRAGAIALTLSINEIKKFEQIADAAEAFYSLFESRETDREQALQKIRSLNPKDRDSLLALAQRLGMIFPISREAYESACKLAAEN